MKLKPPDKRQPICWGMPFRGFFRFFAAVNLLMNAICVILLIYDIKLTLEVQVFVINPLEEEIKLYIRKFAWAWFIFHCLLTLIMDIRLFRTATSPNTTFLRFYAVIQCISMPIFCIWYYALFLSLIIGNSIIPHPPVLANVFLPGHVLYRIYTSYVVYRYSRDIDFDLKMKSGYRDLTEEEIELFENGMPFADEEMKQKYFDSCYEMAQFMSYKRQEFEIDIKDLDFSESSTLGCGEYGCVYKVLWNTGDNTKMTVAVKTVDPEMSDINQFKALLTEAKVMMNLGRHENVVELLGICTTEIRKRKLYIVCELCEFGNLRAHLRSERNTFLNLFVPKDCNADYININIEEEVMSSIDLVRWAFEIADGMEFLTFRKIVHGDLAARNILLTASKSAKITDFGLSRRLYNYSVYKKRHNVPLPWRWLALESLVDMNFSSRSDVWSYAICCWEIFELGARPWPEFQLFTSEFIDALKDGKMLSKGEFCTDEIYDVICSCWKIDPYERPSFSVLKGQFSTIFDNLQSALKLNK